MDDMVKNWLKFPLTMFPRVQLLINQHWFRYWLGAENVADNFELIYFNEICYIYK